MPGMLEYLLLEDGLNAGLTNSPDFFLTSEGLLSNKPSSSLSSEVAVGETSNDVERGMISAVSVDDRECEILRASAVSAVGETVCDTGSESACVCVLDLAVLGELSLLKSIDRTAS